MHNQENSHENELYRTGMGDFLKLYKKFGMQESPIPVSGTSSLQSWLPHFNKQQTMLLVHNTFIAEDDIAFAQAYANKHLTGLYFCICLNANLYIENAVPPIDMLLKHGARLTLGTDSYSSNWQLSISAEIRAIRKHFPTLPLQMIMQWATIEGAKALVGMMYWEVLKREKPGVVLFDDQLQSSRIC